MQDHFQKGGGQYRIGEEVVPDGTGFVGREDGGFPLIVAFGDDLPSIRPACPACAKTGEPTGQAQAGR